MADRGGGALGARLRLWELRLLPRERASMPMVLEMLPSKPDEERVW